MPKSKLFIELTSWTLKHKLKLKRDTVAVPIEESVLESILKQIPKNAKTITEYNSTGFISEKLKTYSETEFIPAHGFEEIVKEKTKTLKIFEKIADTQKNADCLIAFVMPVENLKQKMVEFIQQKPKIIILLIPASIAQELNSFPGSPDYTEISVLVQTFYSSQECEKIPAQSFFPQPSAQYQILKLSLRKGMQPELKKYYAFLKELFRTKGKDLGNVLGKEKSNKIREEYLREKIMLLEVDELKNIFLELEK
ncbi:MAG: rRNA adenine N-6-methyltransferase family protein [Candidatus Diapherotrites archaeon]|nr:rRNA adenine N-6-methyltransferase family protein [Candidatus Diapherotrites archaeon]